MRDSRSIHCGTGHGRAGVRRLRRASRSCVANGGTTSVRFGAGSRRHVYPIGVTTTVVGGVFVGGRG